MKVNWFSVSVSSHSSGARGKAASDSKVPVGETPSKIWFFFVFIIIIIVFIYLFA